MVALTLKGIALPEQVTPPKTAVLDRGPTKPSLTNLRFKIRIGGEVEHLLPFVKEHLATLEKIETRTSHPKFAALMATAPR